MARGSGASAVRDDRLDELFLAASQARSHAYAPYSNFPVGVALLAEDGQLYVGCNVENASYPVGTCAEAGAIGAMVAGGSLKIAAILVLGGDAESGLAPCGACRQRIMEFASSDAVVYCAGPHGIGRSIPIGDLLPHSFAASDLRR